MLHQALRAMGKQSFHYRISIISATGVLMLRRLILSNRTPGTGGIVFVSTAGRERSYYRRALSRTLEGPSRYPEQPRLVVLATDPADVLRLAASDDDDWLIPFRYHGRACLGSDFRVLCLGRRRPAWLYGLRSPSVF